MPVLCDSKVYPSGLAEATNCAPTCPAAPALASTTTGCLRIGSMAAASGRVTRSLMPPGGNALMMVMACEGKVSCANAGPAASAVAAVPMTKRRRSMCCLLEPDFPGMTLKIDGSIRACTAVLQGGRIFRFGSGPRRARLVRRSDQDQEPASGLSESRYPAEFTCIAVCALFRSPRSRLVHNNQLSSRCRPPNTKQIDVTIAPPLPDVRSESLAARIDR